MAEETTKIDLNPMALALMHPHPTVILTAGRQLFIRLNTIIYIVIDEDSGQEFLLLKFADGSLFNLGAAESREFMEKVSLIAGQVQLAIDAQQRQSMQITSQQLSKMRVQ